MSKIEQLLKKHCPKGVEFIEVGQICDIKTGKGITKNDAVDGGLYPIISGGKQPMGYYKTHNRKANCVTISRVGANAGFVNFIDVDFYLNDKCFSVLFKEGNNVPKYLFYYLKSIEDNIKELQSEGGVPTINTNKVANIKVPIPPLPIQQEIVTILDKFTALEAELEAELEARSRQYEYYRNQLLSFEGKEVQWKALGDVGEFVRGNGLQKKDFTETGVGCIHYGQIYTHYGIHATKTKSFVSEELAKKLKKAQKNDLVIAGVSENVEDVCKAVVWLGEEDVCISGDAFIFRHNQNPKYIGYLLQTSRFLEYKKSNAQGAKVTRLRSGSLPKYRIPIPSLQEQERIVNILDQFDALVNDIKTGLPAEIKARRAQYEYYRKKLLTFKRESMNHQ